MKILLDPIYSTYPSRCSSAAKCAKLVETFLKDRTDVFFYWLYPSWVKDDEQSARELAWFSQHPNVQLIAVPTYKDRMREYTKFTVEMDNVFAFNGGYWDIDGVFTSRTSLTPLMRAVMTSPRIRKHGRFLKTIVDFEEMIVLSLRPTVAISDVEAQEALTCIGYLAADKVLLVTAAEKQQVLTTVKQYLSPAMVRKVDQKIVLGSQVMFGPEELKVKKPEHRFIRGQRKFCLSFTGRLESSASNLDVMYEVMDNQFAWRGVDMKVLICTVTPVAMHQPPEYAEVRHPSQKEFWTAIKEEMDLVLALHNNVEWSLSIFEPMLLGTPVLLHDQQWSRDILGDTYPFYVKGMSDVYGWVREFYVNYEKWFAVWEKYHTGILVPMFTEGGRYGTSMYDLTRQHFDSFVQSQKTYIQKSFEGKAEGIPKQIAEFVKDRQSFNLFEVIEEMGNLPVLKRKIGEGDRETRRITFSTDWTEMRLIFKHIYGWKDAAGVGSFQR